MKLINNLKKVEVPIVGMDCMECTLHVQRAIEKLPGVSSVDVILSTEKAIIELHPFQVDLSTIQRAVEAAGYSMGEAPLKSQEGQPTSHPLTSYTRPILILLGVVFGWVLFVVVVGEWLGFLPPIFAAALQSLPDLGILANSSRLLRQAS